MNKEKQTALESAGWIFEDAEDFLELTAEERAIVEFRVRLSRAVRARREKLKLTQAELAQKINTSQPRVNKIEAGSPGVSLEQLMSSWYALGGTVEMILKPRVDAGTGSWLIGHGGSTGKGKVKKSNATATKKRVARGSST